MYAIIETGGKQYRVAEGDVIKVEKLNNITDNTVTFNKVMMVADGDNISVGNPFIESAKVTADVLETAKGKKVLIFKQKTRKGHRKLRGHRQYYTAVRIKNIQVN